MSGWTWRAPNEMTGSGAAAVDALARGRGPARRLGEHAQQRRLVQPEGPVAGGDSERDLLRRDGVAVVERLDRDLRRVRARQGVREEVLDLVDAAQDGLAAAEDLHRHDGIEALALEDAVRAREVDVGGLAGQDLAGGPGSADDHQSRPSAIRRLLTW